VTKEAPKLPRREATARQALIAIGFVFFLGIAVGFVLARTL
jgi:hypothetical protein